MMLRKMLTKAQYTFDHSVDKKNKQSEPVIATTTVVMYAAVSLGARTKL